MKPETKAKALTAFKKTAPDFFGTDGKVYPKLGEPVDQGAEEFETAFVDEMFTSGIEDDEIDGVVELFHEWTQELSNELAANTSRPTCVVISDFQPAL